MAHPRRHLALDSIPDLRQASALPSLFEPVSAEVQRAFGQFSGGIVSVH
jgi:hypothetical protein